MTSNFLKGHRQAFIAKPNIFQPEELGMRKLIVALLIVVLGVGCFASLIGQTIAQETTETTPTTSPSIIIRWTRFRGAVTQWGSESYHGSVIVKTKTANVPPALFRPWATVDVVWSNERRPIASAPKPVGQVTYTHYNARLVRLIAIKGRQDNMNLNITGIWNANKVKITAEFDENGVLIKTVREVTPIATKAKGQLHITEGWKKFDIEIEDVETLKGNGIAMTTTTSRINPFSYEAGSTVTIKDLIQIVRCFRAMPGFGNYIRELDYNMDSKIDLADLTTLAANM